MAEMQLNEIRVDPLTNRQEDPLSNRPEQGSKMAMSEIQGTSSQTNERSLWLSGIVRGVEGAKTKQRYSGPMIPKVPDKLKHENKECYKPSVVSIGPYHYQDRQNKLHEGEKLKVQMAHEFVLDSKIKDIEILYTEVAKVAENAKRFYEGSSISCFDDEQFTRMMFLDGCFILQFIRGVMDNKLDMSDQQIILVKQDLLLLENQLPFSVLKSLMSLKNDGDDRGKEININDFLLVQILQQSDQRRPVWVLSWLVKGYLLLLLIYTSVVYPFHILQGKDSFFFSPLFGILVAGVIFVCKMVASLMRSLLCGNKWQAAKYHWPPHQEPAHILELLYSMFIRSQKEKHKLSLRSCCIYDLPERLRNLFPKSKLGKRGHNLYYSAKDLQKVGIHFKPSKTSTLMDVKFVSSIFYATLKIPSITIEMATRSMLLNLVAYETAAFLDDLWVTSYICFIDSLIDDAEDVKVLRSKGILINYLGPDQKVADLFNQIGRSLETNTNIVYDDVKRKINVSCDSTWKKWIAEWQQTYFSSPWAFIAFVAAAAVLVLTATQTYYTVYPYKSSDSPMSVGT
ncbi:uncharacterized protein LOC133689101 isoform X1 [Populus nigra]|uniref:uncharacterized protein LOC133689101 isoform X1 n=2 Tax=Populus nigra TaxID=3691 RepID=UPI002B267827|nr:uncharacterized protein LOC133689101 isoform X1 [Populus nigra]XP_061964824.1 uncharacterized protein LOC133689101 isoform X1 [Populus nigra]XP_061964825.1 uncharacterized protein LOC133689101 isoform X1 [Populus nigra]